MLNEEKIYTIQLAKADPGDIDLIGIQASGLAQIANSGIPMVSSFIITSHAFDNFLIANDMIAEINTRLKQGEKVNLKEAEEISKSIKLLFKESVMPPSIYESIRAAYTTLSGIHEASVCVKPSWLPDVYKYNGGIQEKYTFQKVFSMNELENVILDAWQALFDKNAIFERSENNFEGPLSIAIVVKKLVNAEVSGRAFSYNPLTLEKNEVEIESILGLWDGVDELELIPDNYIVSKDSLLVIQKNVTNQEKMLLRRGFVKEGEKRDIEVSVSKVWNMRQKVVDETIIEIGKIASEIENILGNCVEIRWVLETGKILITDIKNVQNLSKKSLNFNPNLYLKEITPKRGQFDSGTKSLDAYVKEIEDEIEGLDKIAIPPEEKLDIENHLASEQSEPEIVTEEPVLPKLPELEKIKERKNIWSSTQYGYQKETERLAHQLWLDAKQAQNASQLNSSEFDGVLGINGEEIVLSFGKSIKNINETDRNNLIEYGTNQIYKLAQQDLNKYIIYSLSKFDTKSASKFLGSSQEGIGLHIENQTLFDIEMEIIKQIRNSHNFRKLWIGIRGINQTNDLREIKKHIASSGLKRSTTFKIFLEIDTVPPLLNIKEYLDESVDGVIIYLDQIIEQVLGSKVKIGEVFNNSIFAGMLKNLSNEVHRKNIVLIANSETFSKNDEFTYNTIKSGITGISLGGKHFNEVRKVVQKLELNLLS